MTREVDIEYEIVSRISMIRRLEKIIKFRQGRGEAEELADTHTLCVWVHSMSDPVKFDLVTSLTLTSHPPQAQYE